MVFPTPSDALAQLASALRAAELSQEWSEINRWVTATEALELEDIGDPWTLEPDELFKSRALAGFSWPPPPPDSEEKFVDAVRALQFLDAWHAPIFPRPGAIYTSLAAHEEARDKLGGSNMLGGDSTGIIIPASAWNRDIDDLVDPHTEALKTLPLTAYDAQIRPSLLRQMLDYTAYMPTTLEVEDPNRPGRFTGRTVRLNYRFTADRPSTDRDLASPIRLGLAPLVEARADAQFNIAGDRYAITPVYPLKRLEIVLDQAFEQDVELLLFPEMSVAEANLGYLSSTILRLFREFGLKNRRTPSLRYVMAGITGPSTNGRYKNFVIVLDRFGREIMRQDKIHRWNLEVTHIERYDLTTDVNPPRELEENIDPADNITLLDLPDLGRVLHLICADSSFNTPADWMLAHCRTDWLHAPIMDQSTRVGTFSADSQWILKRAFRAACLGHNRVAVTNSVMLTCRANDANQAVPAKHAYIVNDVTVGLLLDAMGSDILFERVAVPIPCPTDMLRVIDWQPGWPAFPT